MYEQLSQINTQTSDFLFVRHERTSNLCKDLRAPWKMALVITNKCSSRGMDDSLQPPHFLEVDTTGHAALALCSSHRQYILPKGLNHPPLTYNITLFTSRINISNGNCRKNPLRHFQRIFLSFFYQEFFFLLPVDVLLSLLFLQA